MAIRITSDIIDQIFAHADMDYPVEACGYLAGTVSGDRNEYCIKTVFRMTNTDMSSEHFTFDVEEQFEVMAKAKDEGLKLVGNYHSHPHSPAMPSEEDIRLAYDPAAIYLIVSLMDDNRSINVFRIVNKEVIFEKIEIITEEQNK